MRDIDQQILDGKPEFKNPVGSLWCKWMDNS